MPPKPTKPVPPAIARGFGPPPFRIALIAVAAIYLFLLVKHPAKKGWKTVFAHFAECTGLFPNADWVTAKDGVSVVPGAKEFRIEGYSCLRKRWEWLDPRPYFPIQADDKESRFARILHYYIEESSKRDPVARPTAHALEDWLIPRHDSGDYDADGIDGPIGGIRLSRLIRETGAPGDPVPRYSFDPLARPDASVRVDILYNTRKGDYDQRQGIYSRCAAARAAIKDEGSAAGSDADGAETAHGSGGDDPWR